MKKLELAPSQKSPIYTMLSVIFPVLSFLSLLHPSLRLLLRPRMLRLAWTEREAEIAVMWTSWLPLKPSWLEYEDCEGEVHWIPPELTVFRKYVVDVYVEVIYTAIADRLRPECKYAYKVGIGPHLWSQTRHFAGITPYSPTNLNSTEYSPRLAIFGDMGIGNFSQPTRSLLTDMTKAGSFDGVIHLGDIAYNLYRRMGRVSDTFLHEIEPIASRIPYMVVPGNHEHYMHFHHYQHIFRMPRNPASDSTNYFYSFNLGKSHIICLNSEAYFYLSNEEIERQYRWLEADLKTASENRDRIPWIFVCMHKPLYCNIDYRRPMEEVDGFKNNAECDLQCTLLRGELEDLFYRFSVDVVFAGHMHYYERELPVYMNSTMPCERCERNYYKNPTAQVSILSGSAGSDHLHDPVSHTPQLWNVVNVDNYGFGILQILNSSHISWEQIDCETREIIDFLTIEKTRTTYN